VKDKLKQLNDYEWLLPKGSREKMNVDAKIIANKKLLGGMEDAAVEQLTNVATLPGVVSPVVGLPDMHWGFIFSEN
jgi:tRNA-splicing ligase RtcB